ncbi:MULTISPECIES: hypothetical protein [Sutterellaceae]|uniref:hypothetical protein n=2 Tax=Burkholderiales TaxID=80840 RepID=UPI00203D8D27|nr:MULTISPECIES: hypothetical protein [Sutterellaceae]
MTIPPKFLVVEKYTGNNAARDFSFSFWASGAADVVVTQAASDGDESVLVLNTDYSILFNLNNLGGTVRLKNALPSDYRLAISRSTPINQELDLVNQGAFYAEDHESAFDKLTAICQELKEVLGRCLKVPSTSNKTPEELLKEIFEAAKNAVDSAESAAKDAIRSENAADRAEAGAQRVEDILANYESGVICKSFNAADPRWTQVSTAYGPKYRLVLNIGSTALIGVYSGSADRAEKVISGVLLSGENVTSRFLNRSQDFFSRPCSQRRWRISYTSRRSLRRTSSSSIQGTC